MAVLAQVVRAQTLRLAHRRQYGFGTQLHIACRIAAGTRQLAVFGAGWEDRTPTTGSAPPIRPGVRCHEPPSPPLLNPADQTARPATPALTDALLREPLPHG